MSLACSGRADPSSNWSSIGKDTWDGSQMFFATPLTRQQMDSLGFATAVDLDILPGSCRNPLNKRSNGVLPVAIYGGPDLDVSQIDVATLQLAGVAPLRYSLADVGGPDACRESMPDGYVDLTLKFSAPAVREAIGPMEPGQESTLALTGAFQSGAPIVGTDAIGVVGSGPTTRPPRDFGARLERRRGTP